MSTRNLEYLFRPTSIAVIGATDRPASVGAAVIRNLLRGTCMGPVMPVNPKYRSVGSVLCYPSVAELPLTPDLAVVCTPARLTPGLIDQLGRRGTRAAIVLTAIPPGTGGADRSLTQAMLDAARPHLLRLLGPNSLGLLVPGSGLNASFAPVAALPGTVALIHQSGALCNAVLDWARARGVGFSHFISLGDMADIDFGDVLDYLASDAQARAILLHIESIRDARKFMSAARAAARSKPVLAIKTGRVSESMRSLGAQPLADDQVFDAAIRRAGMLRVFTTDEMFDAVETLARAAPIRSDRLVIVTNGAGPGMLAVDDLIGGGGRLAELTEASRAALGDLLSPACSVTNPIDILANGSETTCAKVLELLLKDAQADAVLVLHAPHACLSSEQAARAVIEVAKGARKLVLTSWMGGDSVEPARQLFAAAGIPTYATPDKAVRAFLHLVRYRRNQDLLMETPPSLPAVFCPDMGRARAVIERALGEDRLILSETETQDVLGAYGIPMARLRIGADAEDAARAAEEIGFPVAVKIISPDIRYKAEVGGVVLNQETAQGVRAAVAAIQKRLRIFRPDAFVAGFVVQEMARRPGAHELMVRVKSDPVFGDVIVFGQGGTVAQSISDVAIALPPLNVNLARELISRTRIAQAFRNTGVELAPTRVEDIELTLLQISQLVIDLPELAALYINPLLADVDGVLALDAEIKLRPPAAVEPKRLAIRPYPTQLEESAALRSGRRVLIRPIRPEDEARHYEFRRRLAPEDLYSRFFGPTRWDIPHSEMARLTQIDYDREMAFIMTAANAEGEEETLGIVRAVTDPNNNTAEFAIIVRSDLKGQGLGRRLLGKMIEYCRSRGTMNLVGHVLRDNRGMQELIRHFGFAYQPIADSEIAEVRLELQR